MSKTYPRFTRWIANALNQSGLSQAALAEKLAVALNQPMDRSKVNKLVLGRRDLSAEEMLAISEICEVDLPIKRNAIRAVEVVGRIEAEGRVSIVSEFTDGRHPMTIVAPPQLAKMDVSAIQVEGRCMAPMYQANDFLFFFTRRELGVPEWDIGMPCLIDCGDGLLWLRQLKRGSEPGLWNLVSLHPDSQTLWDVKVVWAARTIFACSVDFITILR